MLELKYVFILATRGTLTLFYVHNTYGDLLSESVTLTASIPFYTNLVYIQISSKLPGRCECVVGQLIYIASPNIYVTIQSVF